MIRSWSRFSPVARTLSRSTLITILVGTLPSSAHAQATGTLTGRVTESNGRPLSGVVVTVQGVGLSVATNASGRYALASVSTGQHQLLFRRIGYGAHDVSITVTADTATTVDAVLDPEAIDLGAVLVEGVSRAPERMLDAPAAVSVVRPTTGEPLSITGQIPLALTRVPGLDVPQSAVNDFNVNARGFNTLLSRKMLVLQDGRDLATVLVLRQTWGALSLPLEDIARIEVIRGPSSAVYGANAYNGVINVTTPAAREIVGTKLTLGGGELGTLRADLRQAGLVLHDRVGYRVNLGYTRSEDWSRSRTARDSSDWRQEYAPATSTTPTAPGVDSVPLRGQTRDSITHQALGTPDPLVSSYGSARVDYYTANGMLTLESGVAREENPVFMTGPSRNQARELVRPWARLAWEDGGSVLSASYSGASLPEGQVALASGDRSDARESAYHLEGRTSRWFAGAAGRVVVGASVQNKRADTKGTLLGSANDDRSDHYYGVFTQVEYRVLAPVRLVGAVRVDDADIHSAQFSPKVAVVVTPVQNHTLRAGVSRAFFTPNVTQLFVRVPTRSGIVNLSGLETQLRADSAVGPALASVEIGKLFTNSGTVPDSTLGNPYLLPQTMISYEAGYKGQFGRSVFLTVDMYAAHIENFITALLGAGTTHLNPLYQRWTAPTEVPAASREAVETAVYSALAANPAPRIRHGLTRLPDSTTAFVLTTGNAGTVNEWGIEVGSDVMLTRALTFSATYTWYDVAIKNDLVVNVVSPNTPRNKGTASLAYSGRQGLDVTVDARFVAGYHWNTAVWNGDIPSSQIVSLSAAYRLNPHVRAFFNATNLFDQPRFEVYGGSVNGRRVLVGMTMMR